MAIDATEPLTAEGRLTLLANELAAMTARRRDVTLTTAADHYAQWKRGRKRNRGPIPDLLSVMEEAVRVTAPL